MNATMNATPMTGLAGWVALPEVGRLLGITRQGVSWRVRKHRLPVVTVGKAHFVRLSDLMATFGPGGHRIAAQQGAGTGGDIPSA